MKSLFIVKFLDATRKDVVIEADSMEYPDEEWGHIHFYNEIEGEDPDGVAAIRFCEIFMIDIKANDR